MDDQFTIKLGAEVMDTITEFIGIVTGRAEYVSGCRQYLVSGKTKDGKIAENGWFDEDRLATKELPQLKDVPTQPKGGPQVCPAPTK